MISLNTRLREFFSQPNSIYAGPIVRRFILGLAFFILFMVVLSADFIQEKVSLTVGQVSDRDVISPRTVSYVNKTKTEKLENEVSNSVANVYDLDVNVVASAEESVSAVFSLAKTIAADKALRLSDQRMSKLQDGLSLALPQNVVTALSQLNEAELSSTEENTRSILRKYLQRGIRDDDLDIARKQIVIETEEMGLSKNSETVVAGIAQTLLKPNFILNIRETEKRKQVALANVEQVRDTVKKGQILVRRGDVVTLDQIHAIEEVGLYKGQLSELRIFGLSIFVLVGIGLALGYLYKFANHLYVNDMYLVLMGLILLVILLLGKAAHYYSDFAAPIAAGSLLTAILIDTRLGLLISVILAMMYGIIIENDLRAVATTLAGCMVGVYSVSKASHGYSLTKTGVWIAGVNFLIIFATGFIDQVNNMQILIQGFFGIFGGIASAVVTTGLLPYLEHTFKITTPIKLLELAKPNHPLQKRLLIDAPGTYHHSILVSNLVETAAEAIGADSIVARVGAYYHDIGKIKRPYFFIENQVGDENPHDKIAPSLSTLIITSHIKDGIDLCQEFKLPQVLIDIVQQHHGTMLVSYFYNRATETEHSECIIETDFRYEGPKPQTKEAALIMLADACEATVSSIAKTNVKRIEATIRKIIRERLNDGQLDECSLTLKDLNVIGEVFIRVLSSMFHTRIEYPDALQELEKKKVQNGNCNKQSTGKDGSNAANGTNSDSSTREGL